MTTTTLTQHEHANLKATLGSWPVAWDHGKWVEREDTMVFLVKEQPRLSLPKEDFEPFIQGHKAEARHR